MQDTKQDTFIPNIGVTQTERYLHKLCAKSFLSMWSYPGLYKSAGDELCDLLVVFGDDILIFSDKYCKFPDSGNLEIDWRRWFKRAVFSSARQAWGAERWIKQHPDRIFTDNKAENKLPFALPNPQSVRFHLIVVAHDGSQRCKKELGGSGSFMLHSDLTGDDHYKTPFIIGNLNPDKSFIHVFDDTTLNILMDKLDTIYDFVWYLEKKEQFFHSKQIILAAGEEELLSQYLRKIDNNGQHDFIFPKEYHSISIEEGFWEEFINGEQYKKQKEADKISYVWDSIIEKFNHHAMTGTQYKTMSLGLQSSEKVLRLMAKEPRVRRRMLSKTLMYMMEKTPATNQAVKYITPKGSEVGTTYVFFLYPRSKEITEEKYREERSKLLEAYCYTAKKRISYAKDIVGIATETGLNNDVRSEDLMYLDGSEWTQEHQEIADAIFKGANLPLNVPMKFYHEKEYPDIVSMDPNALTVKLPKNPRNKPCPCGSGKKYKYCHGK